MDKMGAGRLMTRDAIAPDIETASEAYSRRFEGAVGEYFLSTQRATVRRMLVAAGVRGGRVLDVGGGHGQLTAMLMAMGLDVFVQGSAASCADRLRTLACQRKYAGFVASRLSQLPFADRSFDVVVGLRLMAHVERWQDLLREMARVSRGCLLIDFSSMISVNALESWLFPIKRAIEGDARPYLRHSAGTVRAELETLGFRRFHMEKQFVVPMALHRGLNSCAVSRSIEGWSRRLGATRIFGSPALLLANRAPVGQAQVDPTCADGARADPAAAELHRAA
jgi:ubiquinone/menaquinone biosynthesis C-methylase UbiE